MSSEPPRNSYLDQVVAQQQRLEVDLKAKRAPNQMNAPAPMRQARGRSETGEMQIAQIEGAIRGQGGGQPPSNAVWFESSTVAPAFAATAAIFFCEAMNSGKNAALCCIAVPLA